MCKITNNIKRRFVKDYNLPIKLYDDDMFDYYIELYDKTHATKYKYQLLKQAVSQLRGEEGFMSEFNHIKDEIIIEIQHKRAYEKLANSKVPVEYDYKYQIPKQNIYNPNFDGKYIVSIDLKKANFNSMRYYDKDLVNDTDKYRDFIAKYTAQPYMTESKQLRQVIFGNLLPKKQQSIQKVIIHKICDAILANMDVKIASAGTDEILILDVSRDNCLDLMAELILNVIPPNLLNMVKLESFMVKHVHPTKPFYVKIFEGKVEFKNIPTVYYPQVYKHFFKLPVENKDLYFEYEGERAAFLNPLYSP